MNDLDKFKYTCEGIFTDNNCKALPDTNFKMVMDYHLEILETIDWRKLCQETQS